MWRLVGGAHNWIWGPLIRQAYVYKGGNGLYWVFVLGVVEEVLLAALVRGVPVEDIELSSAERGCRNLAVVVILKRAV